MRILQSGISVPAGIEHLLHKLLHSTPTQLGWSALLLFHLTQEQ